jgi:DNA-directed RNA polymerase subunit RPC12/RpoP
MSGKSGWRESRIGEIREIEGIAFALQSKKRISYHRCPECSSRDTYHKLRVTRDRKKENPTWRNCLGDPKYYGDAFTLRKADLCLDCGAIWVFELFHWVRVGIPKAKFIKIYKKRLWKKSP